MAFPATSQVEGELRELRCHYGPVLYRVLYRRSKNLYILLHMLRKNTGRLPASDIAIAHTRWEDFKARMDAQPRRPPRPAGGDAIGSGYDLTVFGKLDKSYKPDHD